MRTDVELLTNILVPDLFSRLRPCQDSWWTRLSRLRKTVCDMFYRYIFRPPVDKKIIGVWKHWINRSGMQTTLTIDGTPLSTLYISMYPWFRVWFWPLTFSKLNAQGALFDWREWIEMTRVACDGDTTFDEAFQKTGRILNIAMTSTHKHAASVVLNCMHVMFI